MEDTIINPDGICSGNKKKPTFWINRPHEGPEQFEFNIESVDFTDGICRFICKSEVVPKDYWPRMVYICNFITGEYEQVGNYELNEGYVFIESKPWLWW
jgi:hypothetical protein